VLTGGAEEARHESQEDNGRNGVQAITDSYARKFGINSRDTVYRALDELQERGLIVRTRDGHKSKTHFATYMRWLGFQSLTVMASRSTLQSPANTYFAMEPPLKLKKKVGQKLELPSDSRTPSRPMSGHDESICRPIVSTSSTICRSDRREYS